MISFKAVHKRYPPEQVALNGIDLKVKEGEFVFVVGASGAGKSTLLRMLYAAERASEGQVVVGGRNLATIEGDHIASLRREIGVVFQDYKLLSRRSVLDNVAFGLEATGVVTKERRRLAKRLLEAIGLADRANSSPVTLSGGEQQRVAVARALLNRPRLVLADEPTGNLDSNMARVVMDLLLETNRSGATVLVVTHNLGLIEDMNKRTIVLDRGRVIGDFERPSAIG